MIQGERVAKIWLLPVAIEYNRGYNQKTLNRVVKLAQEHQQELLEVWNAYFQE